MYSVTSWTQLLNIFPFVMIRPETHLTSFGTARSFRITLKFYRVSAIMSYTVLTYVRLVLHFI